MIGQAFWTNHHAPNSLRHSLLSPWDSTNLQHLYQLRAPPIPNSVPQITHSPHPLHSIRLLWRRRLYSHLLHPSLLPIHTTR